MRIVRAGRPAGVQRVTARPAKRQGLGGGSAPPPFPGPLKRIYNFWKVKGVLRSAQRLAARRFYGPRTRGNDARKPPCDGNLYCDRASDVLNLRTERLRQRMTVRELKTGKTRRVYFPRELYLRLVGNAGKIWVFEGRTDYTKHRTRQAVYRDVRLCAAFFQRSGVVPRGATIGTHTGRKMAAVREMQRTGDIEAVGRLLNHSGRDKAVTMLYALADQLTAAKLEGKGGHLHE